MAWKITETPTGYNWFFAQSGYGSAGGIADTLNEAKVALAIAEADMMGHPFPPSVAQMMREDPDRFAGDLPDPE